MQIKGLEKIGLFGLLITLVSCGTTPQDSSSTSEAWNEESSKVIHNALGDATIPYFEAETYYAENQDYMGTTMAVLNCVGGFEGSASELIYTLALQKEGYAVEDLKEEEGCIYAEKALIPDQTYIVIQYAFFESYENMQYISYFAIVTFLYQEQAKNEIYDSWPETQVLAELGKSIPAYEDATSYEVAYDVTINGQNTIDIYCTGVKTDAESVYCALLEASGYALTPYNGIYYATNETEGIEIVFYYRAPEPESALESELFVRAYLI